jgi:hypothetical protein
MHDHRQRMHPEVVDKEALKKYSEMAGTRTEHGFP